MEKFELLDLQEIANWQLDAKHSKSKVGLPPLQRGYVWKPKQVETLWDSLLRGFPIGSFLVSENVDPNVKKDLLDGQQRATAIGFGFYNPWEKGIPEMFSNKFKDEETIPILWLDIGFKEEGDFKFLPRLVTQSHPWGFNHNSTPLGIAKRRDANEQFKKNEEKKEYPHYNLKDVYPWYAELPIPFVFLIEALTSFPDKWQEKVIEKSKAHLKHITVEYKNANNEKTTFLGKLEDALKEKNIVEKIEKGIEIIKQTQIPIITLPTNQSLHESNSTTGNASTLFVRINTSGTPLQGEELIYSMYKTEFKESKEIVEAAGAGFIAPSRIITLISRIVQTDIARQKSESDFKFAKQLDLIQFKNAVKDKKGMFYVEMKKFADDNSLDILSKLFKNAKDILLGEEDYQLSSPLAIDIARGNTDILFILLYWLHATEKTADDILKDKVLHKKILAAITTLYWFALNTNKYLEELAKTGTLNFWDSKLFTQQTDKDGWLAQIIEPKNLRDILINKIGKTWQEVFKNDDEEKINNFLTLFNRLNNQRSFLLYAQRKYFKDEFKELQWDTLIEDTNRPYDWDHMYPDSWWTYYEPNKNEITIEWRWCIGNIRALALTDNRSQGNRIFPKERFENIDIRKESFITDKNYQEFWERIDKAIDKDQAEILANAIVHRLADIYEEWYSTLNVGELLGYENKMSEKIL